MLNWLYILVLASVGAWANPHLRNDREGEPRLISRTDLRELQRWNPSADALRPIFEGALPGANSEVCAFTFNTSLHRGSQALPGYQGRRPLLIKAMRQAGLIDDVVMGILLKADEAVRGVNSRLADDEVRPADAQDALAPFSRYQSRRARGACLDENFRQLLGDFRNRRATTTPSDVLGWAGQAERQGLISPRALAELRAAVRAGVGEWRLTLKDYVDKKNFLRRQFPLARNERSNFVATKPARQNVTHRQRLFDVYSGMQIAIMADVIRSFRAHLDSPRIEITVYDGADQVIETVSLDPMERFRFAIRYMRKEMRELSVNSYMDGLTPSYTDLMAAAYEVGVVTARELDEVAALEEIWNPRQTFAQKAMVWGRLFAGALSVALPPPYGFIPSLALVAIQAVMAEQPDDTTDSLF